MINNNITKKDYEKALIVVQNYNKSLSIVKEYQKYLAKEKNEKFKKIKFKGVSKNDILFNTHCSTRLFNCFQIIGVDLKKPVSVLEEISFSELSKLRTFGSVTKKELDDLLSNAKVKMLP